MQYLLVGEVKPALVGVLLVLPLGSTVTYLAGNVADTTQNVAIWATKTTRRHPT